MSRVAARSVKFLCCLACRSSAAIINHPLIVCAVFPFACGCWACQSTDGCRHVPAPNCQRFAGRHPSPTPPWSLAHLTRLTKLTLRGRGANAVKEELFGSCAPPVLPASLVALRWDSDETLHFWAEER